MQSVYAKHSPQVINCEAGTSGYSFYFDLISVLWRTCPAEGAIHRLCSLMRKMGARTLVREELDPNLEIAQEFEDVEKRLGRGLVQASAHRLSFFAAGCPTQNWHELPESSFLGYAVILVLKMPATLPPDIHLTEDWAYILEAVTRPPAKIADADDGTYVARGVTNYYVHCQKRFTATIGIPSDNKQFTVDGVFFCQQNSLTHVCAHAALRMILNTADGLVACKVTNRQLNDILVIDHQANKVVEGLTVQRGSVKSCVNCSGASVRSRSAHAA